LKVRRQGKSEVTRREGSKFKGVTSPPKGFIIQCSLPEGTNLIQMSQSGKGQPVEEQVMKLDGKEFQQSCIGRLREFRFLEISPSIAIVLLAVFFVLPPFGGSLGEGILKQRK